MLLRSVRCAGLARSVPALTRFGSGSLRRSIASSSSFGVPFSSPPPAIPSPLYSADFIDPDRFKFGKYVCRPKRVAIIGAPMALGQPQLGVDQGPAFIRSGGLHARLEADDWIVDERGDVDFANLDEDSHAAGMKSSGQSTVVDSPIALNSLSVGHANFKVYEKAFASASSDQFVLTLGGDHSIAIGSVAAILKARPEVAILWVDAHSDINTPTASGSKNIHGMVLSFLMDLDGCRATTPGFEWMVTEQIPLLRPDRLAYIGLRDLDWGEKQIIKALNIKAFTMKDVDHLGIAEVTARASSHLLSRVNRPLHLSFDIDSIDPMYAPSTGTRVNGGLTYREAYYICEIAAETGMLASMDLVEVNPAINAKDGQADTVGMAVGLCASALGNKIL